MDQRKWPITAWESLVLLAYSTIKLDPRFSLDSDSIKLTHQYFIFLLGYFLRSHLQVPPKLVAQLTRTLLVVWVRCLVELLVSNAEWDSRDEVPSSVRKHNSHVSTMSTLQLQLSSYKTVQNKQNMGFKYNINKHMF